MSLLSKVKENEVLKEYGSEYKSFLEASKDNVVISPSGLRSFISNRGEWYNNTILREKTFNGNVASTIGSLLHQYAEDYYNKELNQDDTMLDWKIKQIAKNYPEAISDFERVYPIFKSSYLDISNKPDYIEQYLEYDLTKDIKLAGSFDFLIKEDNEYIIGDYKSSARSFKDIESYILQLSVYSLLVELVLGFKIDKVRVVGIITTKEPKIIVVEDKPNVEFVKNLLNDVVYSIQLVRDNPDLKSIIFPFNYYDMFNSGEDKERLGSKEPSVKELDKTTLVREKLKRNVFG